MPQSGARMTSSGFTYSSARFTRATTSCGVSIAMSDRSRHPTRIFLPFSFASTEQSRLDCAVSTETWLTGLPASSGRKE